MCRQIQRLLWISSRYWHGAVHWSRTCQTSRSVFRNDEFSFVKRSGVWFVKKKECGTCEDVLWNQNCFSHFDQLLWRQMFKWAHHSTKWVHAAGTKRGKTLVTSHSWSTSLIGQEFGVRFLAQSRYEVMQNLTIRSTNHVIVLIYTHALFQKLK